MRNHIILAVIAVLIFGILSLIKIQCKDEEHQGFRVRMRVTTSEVFSKVYGYNLTGKIQKFVYKEPGEETSLVAIVQGEDVPIYLLKKKD